MGVLYATAVLGAAAWVLPWLWDNVVVVIQRLWATRNIPEPTASWLLGHIPTLVQSRYKSFRCFHQWSLKWPIFRVRFFWRPVIVVTDPDVYQPLLRQGPHKLPKYTAPYRMFEVFTNPERSNILTSPENDTYKAVRRAAVAALTMNNLRLCFPQITSVTQRLISALLAAGPTAVHNMDAVAAAITVDVIGLAAFDRDLQATCTLPAAASTHHIANNTHTRNSTDTQGPQQDPKVLQAPALAGSGDTASVGSVGIAGQGGGCNGICGSVVFPRGAEVLDVISHLVVAMQGRNNPLNRWFPWRQAYRDLFYWGGHMSDLVRDLTSSMEATPPPPHTLGAHLLKAQYSTGQPLDRDQIMAEIGIMWGAGFETTAHTICWTLFLLATHPEAEARLCAELNSLGLLATPDRPTPATLQWEHLGKLKYLSAVLNESMRLYPAASTGTIRITHKPIKLAGHLLPAGQPILMPFWAIHRSPRLWDEPNSFRPERFLSANAAASLTSPATSHTEAAVNSGGPAPEEQHSSQSSGVALGTLSAGTVPAGAAEPAAGPAGLSDDDDYVDVAADIAALRDQQNMQDSSAAKQYKPTGNSTAAASDASTSVMTASSLGSPAAEALKQRGCAAATSSATGNTQPRATLELKDPTVDRRGFLPFSIGSRNCVGQALALVELKAVLALLLGNFSFTLDPSMGGFEGVDAAAKQTVTLRPEHGLLMTLTPRAAATTAPGQV